MAPPVTRLEVCRTFIRWLAGASCAVKEQCSKRTVVATLPSIKLKSSAARTVVATLPGIKIKSNAARTVVATLPGIKLKSSVLV